MAYNRPLGLFLSFEGVDGSGKTTQIELLADWLRAQGRAAVVAQEPGGTRVGLEIRKLLLDSRSTDLQPLPELLLYFASRAQNLAEVIRPALEAGKVVIADRFTDATLAYQGYGRGLGAETVRAIDAVACGGMEPDLTFWLDLDPEVGLRRALSRESAVDESRMEREDLDFRRKVREGYLRIHQANPKRVKRIDASGDQTQVFEVVRREVERAL